MRLHDTLTFLAGGGRLFIAARSRALALLATGLLALAGCDRSHPMAAAAVADPDPAPARSLSAVPSGAPPAAFDTVSAIPEPKAWPFAQGAPRTSGTGRYAFGGFYWTDFLYDANGAAGPAPPLDHLGTSTGGAMVYPDPARTAGNGADLFRIGIGADAEATYWRVDWQTLVDPAVPLAAFALDFTPGGTGPTDAWPGVPRLRSAGVDAVLLLSSAGARLIEPGGSVRELGRVAVDLPSRSFVARIPRALLDPRPGTPWRIRVAATLHDGSGSVRDDMTAFRGLPQQPPVFNLAFRSYDAEPAANNFWFDQTQALQLALGDATPFAIELDWSRLDRNQAEPESLIHGFSNRWYVSSLDPAQEFGRTGIDDSYNGSIGHPVFMDRVQPYGLYVPASYDPADPLPTPLTLMLHSFTQNHNQYGATAPNFQRDACEARGAICLTTLGRGPAGGYEDDAELDLWDAWQDVAQHFRLDPERTITSGYSMGANGSLRLLSKYPDVFLAGVVLAGSQSTEPGLSQLANLQWNGYYHAHGTFDELIPFPEARATIDRLRALGYAYTFDHFLAEDHVVWPLKDELYSGYAAAAQWMAEARPPVRKQSPGEIHFAWDPADVKPQYGIGPIGPWWIGDLEAAPDAALATVHAISEGRPEAALARLEFSQLPVLDPATPSPRLREQQTRVLDAPPMTGGQVTLALSNVVQLSLDLEQAGIAHRGDKRVVVGSNRAVRLILLGLPPDARAHAGGAPVASANGRTVVTLPAGEQQVVAFD